MSAPTRKGMQQLHEMLLKVQAQPKNPHWGLCVHLAEVGPMDDKEVEGALDAVVSSWPLRAGRGYFIPASASDNTVKSAVAASDSACRLGTMWDTTTEYGRLRWAFLSYAVRWLEEQIAAHPGHPDVQLTLTHWEAQLLRNIVGHMAGGSGTLGLFQKLVTFPQLSASTRPRAFDRAPLNPKHWIDTENPDG